MGGIRGQVRVIHVLRVVSSLGLLAGLILVVNGAQRSGSELAGLLGGGVVVILASLAARLVAERRASRVNAHARAAVTAAYPDAPTTEGEKIALQLRAAAPFPADDRFVRAKKEKRALVFVGSVPADDAVEALQVLARMIDADRLVTGKERDRLARLQAGQPQVDELQRLEPRDLVTLATMAADPSFAVIRA